MNITERIRHIRESKGLTQEDLAERFNVTRSNYAYLEGRGAKLTIEQLQKIAEALGVGIGDLMGTGSGEAKSSTREAELEKRVVELEDRVKDKSLIISNLEIDINIMKDDFDYHIEQEIIQCALENNIVPKESYDEYIDVSILENSGKLWWHWKPERYKMKSDMSLFITKEQILQVLHKADSALTIKVEGAYYGNYLTPIVKYAYDEFDGSDENQGK